MEDLTTWLSPKPEPAEVGPAVQEPTEIPSGATMPQYGVPAPGAGVGLPLFETRSFSPLWVVGVHGGAGESRLASLISGATAAEHRWPVSPVHAAKVLLVARLDGRGLQAAQAAMQQWASNSVPGVQLEGIVLMPDAPRRAPRTVLRQLRVLEGGVPRTWVMPWVEAWREGTQTTLLPPRALAQLAELTRLTQ